MRILAKLLTNAKLLEDRRGATAIEYALVASLISAAAIPSSENLGVQVDNRYQAIDKTL